MQHSFNINFPHISHDNSQNTPPGLSVSAGMGAEAGVGSPLLASAPVLDARSHLSLMHFVRLFRRSRAPSHCRHCTTSLLRLAVCKCQPSSFCPSTGAFLSFPLPHGAEDSFQHGSSASAYQPFPSSSSSSSTVPAYPSASASPSASSTSEESIATFVSLLSTAKAGAST